MRHLAPKFRCPRRGAPSRCSRRVTAGRWSEEVQRERRGATRPWEGAPGGPRPGGQGFNASPEAQLIPRWYSRRVMAGRWRVQSEPQGATHPEMVLPTGDGRAVKALP